MAELVEAGQRELGRIVAAAASWMRARLHHLGEADARGAAEDDEVDQAVGAEAVGAVDADAGRFADREQAGHDRVRVAVLQGDDLAVIVRRDAAHRIMDRRRDRDRLARQVDARRRSCAVSVMPGSRSCRIFGIDMVEMKEDMVLMLADAAALADFHRHRA